ncbi:MAG: serine hydrolase [Anaeromyxobacter sp.]
MLAAALALAPASPRAAPPDRFPRAAASYVVAVNGEVVWARAADVPRAPASLTKIMTALLVAESGRGPGTWLPVSRRAAAETGSRLGLTAGDALTLQDALTATLVSSSNDACVVLAEGVGGSVSGFLERMNARARALGLARTHFADPCGHDARGHQATAADLLVLTRTALAVPELRRIAALQGAQVTTRAGRTFTLRTHNALLGRLRGADGVKSGYTPGAGRCVVARAEREGVEVLVVLLDAPDRWWTAAALLEAGFDEARHGG